MSDARERDALRREVKELRSMFKASIYQNKKFQSLVEDLTMKVGGFVEAGGITFKFKSDWIVFIAKKMTENDKWGTPICKNVYLSFADAPMLLSLSYNNEGSLKEILNTESLARKAGYSSRDCAIYRQSFNQQLPPQFGRPVGRVSDKRVLHCWPNYETFNGQDENTSWATFHINQVHLKVQELRELVADTDLALVAEIISQQIAKIFG